MALRSSFKSKPDGNKHTVTLEVSVTGGTKQNVQIDFTWDANDLGYPEQVSPPDGVASATKVSWPPVDLTAAPSVFQVTLHCATSGQHTVDAVGKVAGGGTYTDQTTVDC